MGLLFSWRRAFAIAACLGAVAAYWAITVALNRPLGAHSVGVNATGFVQSTTSTTVKRAPARPGALRAPRAGTYDVRVDTSGRKTTGTVTVSKDGAQSVAIDGFVQESRLAWSARALLIRSAAPSGDGSCEWTPAPVLLAPRLTEGRRWSSSAACTTTVNKTVVTITRQESSKVTRAAHATLDGKPIDTWVIERHVITTQRRGSATTVIEQASTELFAPSLGLPVFKLVRTETPRPDGTVETVLQSIELAGGTPH